MKTVVLEDLINAGKDFSMLENNILFEKELAKKGNYLREVEIQKLVVKYCRSKDLIVNGDRSGDNADFKTIMWRKKLGQTNDMPDIRIDKYNGVNSSFYLELKTMKGVLRQGQKDMIKKLQSEHIPCSVSYGIYEAIYMIEKYLIGEPINYKDKKDLLKS